MEDVEPNHKNTRVKNQMSKEKFSIIVTTNRDIEALKPLFVVTDEDSELIIIDKSYNKKTKDWLEAQSGYKKIIYAPVKESPVHHSRNFSQGLNTALMFSEHKWIVKADDNLEFRDNFFTNARENIENFSEMLPTSFAVIGRKLWASAGHKRWTDPSPGPTTRHTEITNPNFTFSFGLYPITAAYTLNGYDERYDVSWGCFDGKTMIETEEGKIPISTIVKNRMPVRVLSYDRDKQKFEYQKIIKYFDGTTKDWYSIKMPSSYKTETTKVTSEHPFLTKNGWKNADCLENNEKIGMHLPRLTQVQRQIIIGSLLGDACLTKHRVHFRLDEIHSTKQKDYLVKKYEMLNLPHKKSFFEYFDERWGCKIESHRVRTKTHFLLDEFQDFYDEKRKKHVLQKYLDELGILGLSIWFMDDGCLSDYRYDLHTEGFDYEEVLMVSRWFEETWGLKNRIYPRREKTQFIITFGTEPARKWIDENLYVRKKDGVKIMEFPSVKNQEMEGSLEFCPITKICKLKQVSTTRRYNIGVEKNQNYIADDLVVHNCDDINFLHRLLVANHKVFYDKELMAFSEHHLPEHDLILPTKLIYDMEIQEINLGKFHAYNPFNLKELQQQFLAKKDIFIIGK